MGGFLLLCVNLMLAAVICLTVLLPATCADDSRDPPDDLLAFLEAASDQTTAAGLNDNGGGNANAVIVVPTHKIWRLNVPGSASNNLHSAVQKGMSQTWAQRLQHSDSDDDVRETRSTVQLHGCNAEFFRSAASVTRTAPQSQHADYSHLLQRFIPRHVGPSESLLVSFFVVKTSAARHRNVPWPCIQFMTCKMPRWCASGVGGREWV